MAVAALLSPPGRTVPTRHHLLTLPIQRVSQPAATAIAIAHDNGPMASLRSSHSYSRSYSASSAQSSGLGRRLSAGPQPQPLTYRELAKGALYNAAQPLRHERPPVHGQSTEELHLKTTAHGSVASLAAGHLYNPTSSVHEVDPPTWPAHGMENVPASTSPFKSYRVERPPSPPRAKPHATTYKGKRPNHQTVASGALYNPYVQNRLPDALQPREVDDPAVVHRTPTMGSRKLYEPAPRTPLRVPVVADTRSELSAYANGAAQGGDTSAFVFPGGNPRSSVHFAQGTPSAQSSRSRSSSVRGQDVWANPAPAAFGTAPARSRTVSDDTIYYHPSREVSIRHVPPPNLNAGMHGPPSRVPSTGGGSGHGAGSRSPSALMHPAPWMDQEGVGAAVGMHPTSLARSRTASTRGPSSLNRELGGGGGGWGGGGDGDAQGWHAPSINGGAPPGSYHSRAPSVNGGGGSQHFDGDAQSWRPPSVHGGGSQQGWHASRAPSVNGGAPPGSYRSRAPSVNDGGSHDFVDSRGAHPSQMPTVIRDSAEFHDGEGPGPHDGEWGNGEQAWGQGDGNGWVGGGGDEVNGGGGGQEWGQGAAWGGGEGNFAEGGADPGAHVLSRRASRSSTIKAGSVRNGSLHGSVNNGSIHNGSVKGGPGSLRGAPSVHSFRAPSAAATHVSRFQEQNGLPVPSRTPSAASHHTVPSRVATPVFELPAVYDALAEEGEDATLIEDPALAQAQWPTEGTGEPAPAPSAHPNREPSVAAASQHSRAPSVVNEAGVIAIPSRAPSGGVPSRAPSRATMTEAAPRTLTRRGKASKASRLGRTPPTPMDVGDTDNIEISIVQPTPTE